MQISNTALPSRTNLPQVASSSNLIKTVILEEVQFNVPIHASVLKIVDFIENSLLFTFAHTYKLTSYVNLRESIITGGALYGGSKVIKFLGLPDFLKAAIYIKCGCELLERYIQIHQACETLNAALAFRYPAYQPMNWDFSRNPISPALAIFGETVKGYVLQAWKITVCFLLVVWEVVKTGAFLRDLSLLTKGDPSVEFYAFTDLAANLDKTGENFGNNIKLAVEYFRSKEVLGNRLLASLGISKCLGVMIDEMVDKYPHVFVEVKEQVAGFKEDLRVILERGELNVAEGLDRQSSIPEDRFVPYVGQAEVDACFQDA